MAFIKIRFGLNSEDGPSKVTQFENSCVGIEEEILWLDISMADALRVQVGKASKHLVHVQLHRHTHTQVSQKLSMYTGEVNKTKSEDQPASFARCKIIM